jgi:hypothetical protein
MIVNRKNQHTLAIVRLPGERFNKRSSEKYELEGLKPVLSFGVRPTKTRIRGEFSKTRTAREFYISDEATDTLKDWIDWKYRDGKLKAVDDLIFQHWRLGEENPRSLYCHIAHEFSEVRKLAGFVD